MKGLETMGGKLKAFSLCLFLFAATKASASYDCSQARPFEAFEKQTVSVQVDRFYWAKENGKNVEKTERVCETLQPLEVGVYDIRGREEEWYDCFYRVPRPVLECRTTFRGKPAHLMVRPAAVIRRYATTAARDTHAHVFLLPEGNAQKYFDTFVRSLSLELDRKTVIIDSVSGGRGPESGQDSFGVRLRFD